jgi:hypothetical protein
MIFQTGEYLKMRKTIDRTCFWEGFGERGSNGKWESVCRIRIYEEGDRAVVVAADVADPVAYPNGTGTSITNCADHLARMVCETFGLDPERMIWVEHYPQRPDDKSDVPTAEFSLVRFTYNPRTGTFSQPSWKYLPREQAVALTGDDTL